MRQTVVRRDKIRADEVRGRAGRARGTNNVGQRSTTAVPNTTSRRKTNAQLRRDCRRRDQAHRFHARHGGVNEKSPITSAGPRISSTHISSMERRVGGRINSRRRRSWGIGAAACAGRVPATIPLTIAARKPRLDRVSHSLARSQSHSLSVLSNQSTAVRPCAIPLLRRRRRHHHHPPPTRPLAVHLTSAITDVSPHPSPSSSVSADTKKTQKKHAVQTRLPRSAPRAPAIITIALNEAKSVTIFD